MCLHFSFLLFFFHPGALLSIKFSKHLTFSLIVKCIITAKLFYVNINNDYKSAADKPADIEQVTSMLCTVSQNRTKLTISIKTGNLYIKDSLFLYNHLIFILLYPK